MTVIITQETIDNMTSMFLDDGCLGLAPLEVEMEIKRANPELLGGWMSDRDSFLWELFGRVDIQDWSREEVQKYWPGYIRVTGLGAEVNLYVVNVHHVQKYLETQNILIKR